MTTNGVMRGEIEPGDIFFVDPFDIEIGEDVRKQYKEAADLIVEMAVSFHLYGQRRAVECRRTEGGRLILDHGFIRIKAARLICSGFMYVDPKTAHEVKVKDRKFKIKVVFIKTHKP